MALKANPRPLAGGAGAENSLALDQQYNSRSERPKRKVEYWIHVRLDGSEERYRVRPINWPPTLRVQAWKRWERTWTLNRDGASVRPPGERWTFEQLDGLSTTWTRPRKRRS